MKRNSMEYVSQERIKIKQILTSRDHYKSHHKNSSILSAGCGTISSKNKKASLSKKTSNPTVNMNNLRKLKKRS